SGRRASPPPARSPPRGPRRGAGSRTLIGRMLKTSGPRNKPRKGPGTLAARIRGEIAKLTGGLSTRLASGLVAVRFARGLTQADVAEAGDLDCRVYQKLEAGELNATLSTLHRLGCAFRLVDPLELFNGALQ